MTTRRQCLLHRYDGITFRQQSVHFPNGIESLEPHFDTLNSVIKRNFSRINRIEAKPWIFDGNIQFIGSKVNEGQIARRIERTRFDIQLSWVDSALQMADPMLLLPLTVHKHNMRTHPCVRVSEQNNTRTTNGTRNVEIHLCCTVPISLYIVVQSSYIEISHSASSRAKTYREPESKSAVERQIQLTLGVLVIE